MLDRLSPWAWWAASVGNRHLFSSFVLPGCRLTKWASGACRCLLGVPGWRPWFGMGSLDFSREMFFQFNVGMTELTVTGNGDF